MIVSEDGEWPLSGRWTLAHLLGIWAVTRGHFHHSRSPSPSASARSREPSLESYIYKCSEFVYLLSLYHSNGPPLRGSWAQLCLQAPLRWQLIRINFSWPGYCGKMMLVSTAWEALWLQSLFLKFTIHFISNLHFHWQSRSHHLFQGLWISHKVQAYWYPSPLYSGENYFQQSFSHLLSNRRKYSWYIHQGAW